MSTKEETLLATASGLYRAGRLDDARRICKQVVAINPDNAEANHLLGIVYFREGRADIAGKHLHRAARSAPSDAAVQYNLGHVLATQGNLDDAIAAFGRALDIAPDFPEARYQLAISCRMAGDSAAAIGHYRKLIRQHPEHIAAYNNLGNLLAATGDTEAAIRVLETAIRLNNADHLCYYNLANIYHTLGNYPEAIANYRRAIGLRSDFHQAYLNIGHILDKLGRWEEEYQLYLSLKAVCPQLPETHDRLGTACMRRGDFTTALEEYDLALELDPDMVNTICSKAELLERTRDYDAAADLVSRALALEPDNAYAGCIAGKLFQQKGELTEAINVLEKARERSTADKITSECCLLLGQLYARTGEYKKSYDLVSEGNRLTASGFEDIDGIRNKFLEEIECGSAQLELFSQEYSAGKIPDDSQGSELVFIVGFPRSGTTLLDVILESHPDIQTVEEKPAAHEMYAHFLREFAGVTGEPVTLAPAQLDTLRSVYYRELYRYAEKDKTRYIVDKFPLNIARAHLLWRVFPAARFILALRHPCDACLSCLMQNFIINSAMANFLTLHDTVTLYGKIMKRWVELAEKLPLNHCSVRYEALVNDFRGEISSLLGFLELEWNENLLSYGEHSRLREVIKTPSYRQVREPIYKRAVYRWENYREFMQPEIGVLEPFIRMFGY